MNAPTHILTSLRHAPQMPLTREELDVLRRDAWVKFGLIVMFPDEFRNDFVRQGAINDVTLKFGRRMKRWPK
jgi:hypothetical protein